jgi:hypothetical protein
MKEAEVSCTPRRNNTIEEVEKRKLTFVLLETVSRNPLAAFTGAQ